jgi:hypothetical protein
MFCTVTRWAAGLLALAGWGGALWSWLDHGYAAGIDPGFMVALSVGICATVVLAVVVVLPPMARLYALGFHDGSRRGAHTSDQDRVLSLVR